ncbi:hypothetical protein ACI2KR_27075 [Pseudomonas luteola]
MQNSSEIVPIVIFYAASGIGLLCTFTFFLLGPAPFFGLTTRLKKIVSISSLVIACFALTVAGLINIPVGVRNTSITGMECVTATGQAYWHLSSTDQLVPALDKESRMLSCDEAKDFLKNEASPAK